MSDRVFEACQYLKCTTNRIFHDQDNVKTVKTAETFDGDFVPLKDAFEYVCAKGASVDEAKQKLSKVVEGKVAKKADDEGTACKTQGNPSIREVRSLFSRIEDYLSRPQLEVCQDFKVSRTFYVAHAAFDDIEADYRLVTTTDDLTICARASTLGEARIEHGKKVSAECNSDNVSCEVQNSARVAVKESLLDGIGNFFYSIGLFFGSGRQPRHVQ